MYSKSNRVSVFSCPCIGRCLASISINGKMQGLVPNHRHRLYGNRRSASDRLSDVFLFLPPRSCNVIGTDGQYAWGLAYGSEWSFMVFIIHIGQQNGQFNGPQKQLQMARYCSLPWPGLVSSVSLSKVNQNSRFFFQIFSGEGSSYPTHAFRQARCQVVPFLLRPSNINMTYCQADTRTFCL